MRILYVEDNEVNQALVERVLRAKQCSVVFKEEGEGALEALAQDSDIDLILLDIELAGTMSGLEVIRAMRARNDQRPVVAVTAYAMMGDRERFLEAGCDQYLPKPIVITDLLNLLDEYEIQLAASESAEADKRSTATFLTVPPASAAQPARGPVTPTLMPAVKPSGIQTSNTAAASPETTQTQVEAQIEMLLAETPASDQGTAERAEPAAPSTIASESARQLPGQDANP